MSLNSPHRFNNQHSRKGSFYGHAAVGYFIVALFGCYTGYSCADAFFLNPESDNALGVLIAGTAIGLACTSLLLFCLSKLESIDGLDLLYGWIIVPIACSISIPKESANTRAYICIGVLCSLTIIIIGAAIHRLKTRPSYDKANSA